MYFFGTGNRLYQNIKFREIPERQLEASVLGIGMAPGPAKLSTLMPFFHCSLLPREMKAYSTFQLS